MTSRPSGSQTSLGMLILGFAILYIVWGSTYIGIKIAIETLPPFLMAGARFLLAGLLMYGVLIAQGTPAPRGAAWKPILLIALLMLVGGNGLVTWSEQWVPSGMAALVAGTTPLWFALLGWLFWGGRAPTLSVIVGLVVGFAGVFLLVGPASLKEGTNFWPFLMVLAAPLLWTIGTFIGRGVQGESALMLSAMQMIVGGLMMLGLGTLLGEWSELKLAEISARSTIAFFYLVTFGSIVGFTTFTWLMRVASPSAVSTYAFVNPLVAVLLGWGIGNEAVHASMLVATALIVGAVFLITVRPAQTPQVADTQTATTASATTPNPASLSSDSSETEQAAALGYLQVAAETGATHSVATHAGAPATDPIKVAR